MEVDMNGNLIRFNSNGTSGVIPFSGATEILVQVIGSRWSYGVNNCYFQSRNKYDSDEAVSYTATDLIINEKQQPKKVTSGLGIHHHDDFQSGFSRIEFN